MRVLVAARLSKLVRLEGQTRGAQTGLESQDAGVLAWAEREGHEIVHVAADFKSGTVPPWKRPNLRPWVTDPNKMVQYDAIVAFKFDRLSRGDDASTAAIEAWARKNGKLLITVSDQLEYPCEGIAGIRWDLAARMAHQEWMEISERYTRMNATLREGGYHVGRAPYGYQAVPKGDHKVLAIEPTEAAVIRDAVKWYLDDMSLGDIAAKLNATGRRPRTMKNGHVPSWAPSNLSRVLHNEALVGRQKGTNGATVHRIAEPILSREIWNKMLERMDKRAKKSEDSHAKAPALLTSIIFCTVCGKAMYRTGPAYYCRTSGCSSRILIDKADAFVHELMMTDDRRDVIETLVPGSGHDIEIADVKRDLAEAVEAEEFERIPELRAELARLRALPSTPMRVERRESDVTVAEMWAAMESDTERRAYLLSRSARIEVWRDEEGGACLFSGLGKPQTVSA